MPPLGRDGRRALSALGVTLKAAVAARGPVDPDALDRRDPELIARLLPGLHVLSRRYLRLTSAGEENIPDTPALFVANHSCGIMGPDLACIMTTLWGARGPEAPIYELVHDFAMHPRSPVGGLVQKLGAVRACRINARRALEAGSQVLVFPGGDLDAFRHFRRRDEIVWGCRCGFVRLAQEMGVPVVPVVVQGAHRSAIVVHEGVGLARLLRLHRTLRVDCFPVALALPWGIALGPGMPYMPLPFSVRLKVLPPVQLSAQQDPRKVATDLRWQMQHALEELASQGGKRGRHEQ